MTGRPISELQRDTVSPLKGYPVRAWALAPANRAVLHQRLETRFHAMLTAGFLDEVRSLRARGDLEARHSSMRAVGYRQLWAHLAGEYDLEEATRRGIIASELPCPAIQQTPCPRGQRGPCAHLNMRFPSKPKLSNLLT